MKWAVITIVAFACVGPKLGQAEPIGVSLEWSELDCTECPELAARFQPKEGRIQFLQERDPQFVALEKKAAKRLLVQHVEWIEPGAKAKHTTRINETTFELELAVGLPEAGVYLTTLSAKVEQGTRLDVKPGTLLTPAQQKKRIQTRSGGFTCELSPNRSWAFGVPIQKPSQAKRKVLDGLAGVADGKKDTDSTILVLTVGLEEPAAARCEH